MKHPKKRKTCMWKDYYFTNYEQIEIETRQLSMIPARFSIHTYTKSIVTVQVRCHRNSQAYNLCKEFGFEWY